MSNADGTVDRYDLRAGYMMTRPTPLSHELLYIPMQLISGIDPREVFVSKSREELHRDHSDPPPRTTVVDEKVDPDTGQDKSRALTSEPSGYDGMPVIVVDAEVGDMAHHIAPGFQVYSSEMETVGKVKEYYRDDKRLLVEHGGLSEHHLIIPIALLAAVDRDKRDIILAVSAADLRRQSRPTQSYPELDDVVVMELETTDIRLP